LEDIHCQGVVELRQLVYF